MYKVQVISHSRKINFSSRMWGFSLFSFLFLSKIFPISLLDKFPPGNYLLSLLAIPSSTWSVIFDKIYTPGVELIVCLPEQGLEEELEWVGELGIGLGSGEHRPQHVRDIHVLSAMMAEH